MEVRVLASAATSGATFDLRCELREKLIAFLAKEHPQALPRGREEFTAMTPQERDRSAAAPPQRFSQRAS